MVPKMIRKMQVPAYCPIVVGVHMLLYRGVVELTEKTTIMDDMSEVIDVEVAIELLAVLVISIVAVEDISEIYCRRYGFV
jgi:hypothetical protein